MKYKVTIPYACFVTIEVDADNEEQAEERAFEDAGISSYAGNGGTYRLIGPSAYGHTIEASDEPLECEGYQIEIYEA